MDAFKFYGLETIPRGTTAWIVPLPWLAFSVDYLMKEGMKEIHVWVVDKETGEPLDATKCSLFIEGVDLAGNRVGMEDFPTEPIPTESATTESLE
jgi:hypothetical protein